MEKVGLVLSWFLGIFFLLVGIASLINNDPLPAITIFVVTFLLLPPIRKFAYSKTNLKLPFYARAISIFVLLLICGHLAGQSQQKGNLEYFSHNASSVLLEIKSLIQSGDYETAISQAEKYMASGNKELADLHRVAKNKQLETEATKRQEQEQKKTDTKQYYSWASKIDKETCDNIAAKGLLKGRRDRLAAIRDNNNMDFALSFCPKCSVAEKSEIATCYEIGYDHGYYGR